MQRRKRVRKKRRKLKRVKCGVTRKEECCRVRRGGCIG